MHTSVSGSILTDSVGGGGRGASVILLSATVLVCVSADREGDRTGHFNLPHNQRGFVHRLSRWKKEVPAALTLGDGAFGIHTSGLGARVRGTFSLLRVLCPTFSKWVGGNEKECRWHVLSAASLLVCMPEGRKGGVRGFFSSGLCTFSSHGHDREEGKGVPASLSQRRRFSISCQWTGRASTRDI